MNDYLKDRVSGQNVIPTLGELIAQKVDRSQGVLAETTSLIQLNNVNPENLSISDFTDL